MASRLIGVISFLVTITVLAFPQNSGTITVKGSDTMVLLAQRWAETYMKSHPDVSIQVTGGGSGTGISALINGTTDICNSSRSMKSDERKKLKEKSGSSGVEIKCSIDGLCVYVHPSNPIRELSIPQVRDIYTGKITNWKELGGADKKIILYSRENNSGTYVYFKEEVLLNADFDNRTQSLPGTAAVVNAISKDEQGIGYGGVAYGKGVRELSLKKDGKSPACKPTVEHIKDGTYPLGRYLYMYLKQKPTGELKRYVDWILGNDGQKIVTEVGYVPIR
jgi:phosphate transport system substrate-binding protein